MAWACGVLGHNTGKLLTGSVLQHAAQKLQQGPWYERQPYTVRTVSNLVWSAAVQDLQQCVPQVLQLVAACNRVWSTAVDAHLQELYQVHLWLLDSQLPAASQGLSGVLSQQQLEQCRASWEQRLAA